MLEKIYIQNPDNTDLNMYRCGMEDCAPGHSWGPAVRDHYLIHYITAGQGLVQMNGRSYRLKKGQGFLMNPYEVTYYEADSSNPWSYSWVGFHGLKAEYYLKRAGLSAENPIFTYDKDDFVKQCFENMVAAGSYKKSGETRMLSYLYLFLAQLIEESAATALPQDSESRKKQYIKKAIEYISMNYSRKMTVSEIAKQIGLDRSYMYSLFMELLGESPQEYIINYRIGRACELMDNSTLSIGEVSRSVGYEDPLLFSKIFKKVKGMPPKDYRKQVLKIQH